jgi:outer membrane protein assembly factor BamE
MILRTTLIWLKSAINSQLSISSRFSLCAIILCSSLISSCAEWLPEAYRIDLQQGNSVKLEQVESLEMGMSKTEVRKIMGSPMLSDPFHDQRWDYIYRYLPRKGFERKSLLTLYFEDDRLVKIDDSQYIEP